MSADGESWFLLNASPEIREQIESFPALWPRARRQSPIAGIVVTNGDLDHCLGLLSLRESHPLVVHATREVARGFTEGNVLYRTLERFAGQVTWRALELDRPHALGSGEGSARDDAGLRLTAFAVPGKRPIHLEGVGTPGPEDNIGVLLRAPTTHRAGGDKAVADAVVAYVPAASRWTDALQERLAAADVVFFDGTFWSSAELAEAGVGAKRAEDMAHLPVGGPGGSLERLRRLPARRKILIHINNTNPMLREDSAERAEVLAAGVEIAADDLELTL